MMFFRQVCRFDFGLSLFAAIQQLLVDAHTALHLYHACLKGELVKGRTVILVSHLVRLCSSGASLIVVLDNGRVQFQGDQEQFQNSDVVKTLVQSTTTTSVEMDQNENFAIKSLLQDQVEPTGSITDENLDAVSGPQSAVTVKETTVPRKLVEQETRAVGRVAPKVWKTYIKATGSKTTIL